MQTRRVYLALLFLLLLCTSLPAYAQAVRGRIEGTVKDPQGQVIPNGQEEPLMGDKADQVKGHVKEAAGDLTDDKDLQREDKMDQAGATVKEKANDAVDAVKDKANDLMDDDK